jgi:hypothetical protein
LLVENLGVIEAESPVVTSEAEVVLADDVEVALTT